jgi:hypothetical protein
VSEMRDLLPFWDKIGRAPVAFGGGSRGADLQLASPTAEYSMRLVSGADKLRNSRTQDSRRDEEASSRMDDEGCPNPRPVNLPEAPVPNGGGLW